MCFWFMKVLDYQKVKKAEREAAKAKFGELNLAADEDEVLPVSFPHCSVFHLDDQVATESSGTSQALAPGEQVGLTPTERAAIMEKIRTATSLAEIEQLEKQLKAPTSYVLDAEVAMDD